MARICKSTIKSDSKEKKATKKPDNNLKVKENNGSKSKKITFSYFDPEAHQVTLTGDFNDWIHDSCLLKRKNTGEWNAILNLEPGTYDYKYIVDGEWRDDPKCVDKVPNPFGGYNCRVIVK